MTTPKTLFEKIWDEHEIADLGDGFSLLFVDRHNINDVASRGLITLEREGLPLRHPELTIAAADHTIPTLCGALDPVAITNPYVGTVRHYSEKFGVRLLDVGDDYHGIIHVSAADLGFALPGLTIVCADSHTCTLGALGAIAWGIGQSETVHVMATQTSVQRKPEQMRITLTGAPPRGVTAKDIMLHVIGTVGVAGASGHAVEFAGPAVSALSMESRFTICNMASETGARFGLMAPDDKTHEYLEGREYAPVGAAWHAAVDCWRGLASDDGATFDTELSLDLSAIEPQVTWGTNPSQVIGIGGRVPESNDESDARARDYIGLDEGTGVKDVKVDMVFIGSCTNSRITDLREAATLAKGRKVAAGVTAWVVPGSQAVKRQAEAEELDRTFIAAGFFWGQPGCSMCGGSGNEHTEIGTPGMRIVSTTNRNFVGRQGAGVRTHLASPVTAVASALAGHIADARELESTDD
jgi:3-isopropylmalate/(R)-2-methylmalate dehydratase large subunit